MIRRSEVRTFGQTEPRQLLWLIDRSQALRLLEAFIADGLPRFGSYRDAMTLKSGSLFHCRRPLALNTKILLPIKDRR